MNRKRKGLSQKDSRVKKSRKSEDNDSEELSLSQSQTNGRAGRVLRLRLHNFMCHSNLEIKLDPNTNYVIGRNGSGKSAILTALIVGLGGKARTTNRGANIKAFIKVGESSSTVEITLSNEGPMAYNPKVFGSKITIIRRFTDTGTNSYKLKSASGELISSALKEIVRVIEALNIHVDNPVCILNQDVARTFLNTNDPQKKYMMFMKATNLENVKIEYKQAVQNKKENLMKVKQKAEALNVLEKEVKQWLKRLRAFDIIENVEIRKRELEVEAVWAQINIIEEEMNEKQEKVDELENEIEKLSESVRNKSQNQTELTTFIEEKTSQLLETRNGLEKWQETINVQKTKVNHLRQRFATRRHEITGLEATIQRKRVDHKNVQNEINNSSSYESNRMKMIAERDSRLIKLDRTIHEMKQLAQTAKNDLMQTRNALNMKENEEQNLSSELAELSGQMKQKQAKIRGLRCDESNAISVYGRHIETLLQNINAHKEQFVHLPRGPLGSFIKLKDKKWALAIEDFLSQGMLMSFCVDNHKDAKLLTKILNEVCGRYKPTIISSKFYNQVHDYKKNKVNAPNHCIAMIDAFTIKDPVVTNCLIDQTSIESVLLVSNNDLARHLMSDASRVPKNCSRAVTLNGDQFYPDPNYRCYACRNKNPRFLQVSAAEVIRIYETDIENYQQNYEIIQNQTKAVSADVRRLTAELQVIQTRMTTLDIAQNRAEKEKNDLALQTLPPQPNLDILREEIKELEKIIENKESEVQRFTDELEGVKAEIKSAENDLEQLKQTAKDMTTKMKPLMDELNDAKTKLNQININAKFNSDKIRQHEQKLVSAKREVDRKKKILAEKLEEAKPLGERLQTNRTVEIVLKELQDASQQLTEIKTTMGDRIQISEKYLELQRTYDKVKYEVEQVQLCLDQMVVAVEARARHYHKLAEYIGLRVREMFTGVLRVRQFAGSIEIDHEKQSLELVVIPQHGSAQGKGHTHILSGGERSYSTVAFLHALWQVMEYPFYFLDEFDVFMDKVNRRTVMDILLDHAKEHSDLQFVFLTPQDISSVIGDRKITVHRMEDPRNDTNPVQQR